MTRQPWTPRSWQPPMLEHLLAHQRCALWAGMGTGKTTVGLTAVDALHLAGESTPVLALAPLRVARSVWPEEAAKWSHLSGVDVAPVVGDRRQREQALRRDVAVHTVNYDNLPWLVEHLGDRWPYQTVIADESTKFKGFRLRQGTARARAIARVAHKHVRRWINLTGTPSPNGLIDLWGQTWFLDAGERLGRTFQGFVDRWFRPSHDGYGHVPLPHAEREIHDRLRDICLTVDLRDYVDVRQPVRTPVFVDLPPAARQLYKRMEREFFAELEGKPVEAFSAAARSMKLLQFASGAVYVDAHAEQWREAHDAKVEALRDVVEEWSGAPVLVAYHFRSDLERLLKAFPRARHLDADPRTVEDWNAGKIPVLFVHPASAGHGLNLQDGGNVLVYFSHDWNLENRQQVLERIGPTRQLQSGHDRPVHVYDLVARDTIDELVLSRVESKRSVQDVLLDAMKRGNC